MKRYIGICQNPGQVMVLEGDFESQEATALKRYLLAPRLDLWNHSPDGFNWGYAGSGPAQLALAILADHIGPQPAPPVCEFCGHMMEGDNCMGPATDCGFKWTNEDKWRRVVHLHQTFKFDVIAKLERDRFELTSEQIQQWVASHEPAARLPVV